MKLPRLLLLVATAAIAVAVSPPNLASSACQFDPSDRFQASEAQLRSIYATMRIALDAIPREDFHVASRQQALGEDPDVLHAWVRDQTRWVGYQGVLRGARGSLMDGYGSHADRALLLAELLESAGHQVRLARARLGEGERDQLLQAVTRRGGINRNTTQAATSDPAHYQALAEQLGFEPGALRASTQQAEAEAEAMAQAVNQTSQQQTAALQAMLELPRTQAAPSEQFESALRDHWWVQIRGRDGGWRDLDPSLPTLAPGQRLHAGQPQTLWPDQIEPADQHRLQIEVVAERFENRRLRERTALEHELLATETIGQSLVLDVHPLGLPATPTLLRGDGRYSPEQLPQKLASQTEWVPLLVIGDSPVVKNSIRDNGEVVDQTQRTGVGDAMREATGALGSIGIGGRSSAQQEPPELTGVFLRLSIQAPGAQTREFERPLMDILGAERRASGLRDLTLDADDKKRRALGMLSSTQLLTQSNWWPSQYALGHLLDGGLRNQRATLGAVHAVRRDDAALMGKAIETMTNTPVDLVALAFHRQAQSAHAEQIVLTELNLLSQFERLDTSTEQPARLRGFDIINNRIDLVPGAGDGREVRLSQGVLDTVLEAQLLSAGPGALNTSLEFGRALEQRNNWQRVSSIDGLPDHVTGDAADHIKQALQRGEWVVLPEHAEPARLTWWRVDPQDGSTLGMGPSGRGQMVEQILALMNSIDNAASAVATVQAVWSCILTRPSPSAMQCCIVREGVKIVASDKLGTLAKQWTPILKFAGDSKIYLAALEGVVDDAAGDIVDNLMPDPC